jgi:hypothetical protein
MDVATTPAKLCRRKSTRMYSCVFVFALLLAAFKIGWVEHYLSRRPSLDYNKLLNIVNRHRVKRGMIRNFGRRQNPKYQLGNTTFRFRVSKVQKEGRPLAVLFTTLVQSYKGDRLKILAQENTLMSYKNLLPLVRTIVFTSDKFWVKRIKEISKDILVVEKFQVNTYKTPILKHMFKAAFQRIEAPFYAYANGDILLAAGFLNTLLAVQAAVLGRTIKPKIFLIGQRFNYNISHDQHSFSVDKHSYESIISNWTSTARLFQSNALDYFVVTKNAFDWANVPPYVIGRPAYDNCLAKSALVREDVETIDGTWTVNALHQSGTDGDKAGMRKTGVPDYNWNYFYCKHGYDIGTTDHMKYHTELHAGGKEIRLLKRHSFRPYSQIKHQRARGPKVYSGGDSLRIVLFLLAWLVALAACFVLVVQATDTFTKEDEIVVELDDILHSFEAHKKSVDKRLAAVARNKKAMQKMQEQELKRQEKFHWDYESD